MKKYLNVAFVALSLFLASQSVYAMDDKDESKRTPVHQITQNNTDNDKTLEQIAYEHVKAKWGLVIATGYQLGQWGYRQIDWGFSRTSPSNN